MAALGDALVSAQGALSTDITTAGKQYRGVSFATGRLQKLGMILKIKMSEIGVIKMSTQKVVHLNLFK